MARAVPWERLQSEVVAEYDVFKVRRNVMRSPRTGEPREFHILDVPACVKIIPFTADGRVVLVEQFRQGVQRVTLEFPAGVVEDGEDPVAAGVRELEEETGYRAARAELLIDFDPDPAIQSNEVKLVIADGCTADGECDQDDGEDVKVQVVDVERMDELIRDGSIRHAATISAWSLYERLRGDRAPARDAERAVRQAG